MNHNSIFVTGTDTGVGKTWVSVALLRTWQRLGVRAVGMKPVASGCQWQQGQWRNEDALLLQAHSVGALDYAQINPYAFAPPIAPHIAAQQAGQRIDLELIAARYQTLTTNAEAVVVEGVGGWLVPLNETASVADLAGRLQLPVLLVVGLRLGCINHALLTANAISATRTPLIGWVANSLAADLACLEENVATLRSRLSAPCWGVLPHAEVMDENWLSTAENLLAPAVRQFKEKHQHQIECLKR